ncbi:MAG: porin family protein [Gammaproteobacteria bacterium]|nr:porin family protein [Gammaproteobacteria bacterium]
MLDRALIFTNRCLLVGLSLGSIAPVEQTFADNQGRLYIGFALAPQLFSDNKAGAATVEFDTGIAFSALAGYKLSNLRLEGELAYQSVEGTSTTNVNADIDIIRFTGAAYYDFELYSLTPYLGGGMGIASLDSSGGFEDDDSGFTWHGEVGLTINLTDQWAILPAYRYEWTDTDLGTFDDAQTAHAFRVTLRYQFQPLSRSVRQTGYDYRRQPTPHYPHDSYYECDPRYNPDCHYRSHQKKHRPHQKKPEDAKTPEQRERDRCGWQGPGCPQ